MNEQEIPITAKQTGYAMKICGMKYSENILEVAALLPDYMGFIFWEPSSRYFTGTIPTLPASIKKVGVFVNASVLEIQTKVNQHDLKAVQLHGHESVAFCQELRQILGQNIEIFKVFSVGSEFDFEIIKEFEDSCDFFLFDTKGKLPGGNGTVFDWKMLQNYPSQKPFLLSGGIGLDEVAQVKEITKSNLPVYALDLNSKFEIEAGLKNSNALKQFQELLRQ